MDLIAVVTGASRGAGKGIAIALGEAGATVYVTGRSVADSDSLFGGPRSETCHLFTSAGGEGVSHALDHPDSKAVSPPFRTFEAERGCPGAPCFPPESLAAQAQTSITAIPRKGGR